MAEPDAVRSLLPYQWVRVEGPSMVPTLRPGDLLLVHRGARIRPGQVVLAVFPSLTGVLVVKRAVERIGDRWQVASDNSFAGGDSAVHGPAEVLGRALLGLRCRPGTRLPTSWVRLRAGGSNTSEDEL